MPYRMVVITVDLSHVDFDAKYHVKDLNIQVGLSKSQIYTELKLGRLDFFDKKAASGGGYEITGGQFIKWFDEYYAGRLSRSGRKLEIIWGANDRAFVEDSLTGETAPNEIRQAI
jgi:hypothetical protein